MNSKERKEDASFLLFAVQFALSALYAIYLWSTTGISAILPQSVFLGVTESPYVFLIGFAAVLVGVIIDILAQDPPFRRMTLQRDSDRLQLLAVVSLVLGALCAWYAADFSLGGAAFNLL